MTAGARHRVSQGTSPVWLIGGGVVATIVAAPIFAIAWIALFPSENIWPHLISTVLPRQLANTALLMLGNGIGVLIIGVTSAWLVTTCRFPGRPIFEWALLSTSLVKIWLAPATARLAIC